MRDLRGRRLEAGDRLPSIEQHLLLRTIRDEQWPVGTTAEAFVGDLRRAVAAPSGILWTYRYHGEAYAAFVAPNDFTPPAPRRAAFVFVAYSATFGVVRTAYQIDDEDAWHPRDGVENAFRQTA